MDVLVLWAQSFQNWPYYRPRNACVCSSEGLKLIPCLGLQRQHCKKHLFAYKYEIEKSNRTFITLYANSGNTDFRLKHSDDNGFSFFSNFFFRIESQQILIKWSRSSGSKSKFSISSENRKRFCTHLTSALDREGK